jgi:hypothetical protein
MTSEEEEEQEGAAAAAWGRQRKKKKKKRKKKRKRKMKMKRKPAGPRGRPRAGDRGWVWVEAPPPAQGSLSETCGRAASRVTACRLQEVVAEEKMLPMRQRARREQERRALPPNSFRARPASVCAPRPPLLAAW